MTVVYTANYPGAQMK